MPEPRIAVVGATGAVGAVTLRLLRERGYRQVRAFASSRSVGKELDGGIVVEEATPAALAAGGIDVAFFSVGTSASRELVPHAVRGGAIAVDKSAAYRLQDGVPLVVPEVNGDRALEHDGILANPNCCAIPLTMALKPLHDAAGLARVRVSTYQSVSGAGAQRMEELRTTPPGEADIAMDWDFEGDESDEEAKLRSETRKILELPELPVSATCVRVPVMVGHAEAVWVETEDPLSAESAHQLLGRAAGRAPAGTADDASRRQHRRRSRRAHPPRSHCCERARPVRRLRQPEQGRSAQRDPDRGARPRAPRRRSLNVWLWLLVALGACLALWLSVLVTLLTLGRRDHARELARFIPDCVVLFKRLLGDERVPRLAKVALVLLIPYLAMPFDVVPDFIPVAGQLDDAILVALVLAYVVRRSSRGVVEELWPGSEAGLRIVLALEPRLRDPVAQGPGPG